MKSSTTTQIKSFLTQALKPALLATVILSLGVGSSVVAGKGNAGNPGILPPQSHACGNTYGEWSAVWWKWYMELPLAGHPANGPGFDVSEGQSGHVWFLGANPLGTVERTFTIPAGKALFIGLLNAEASDLEGLGATEAERRATAEWFADHIVGLSCSIDGVTVANIGSYRVQSPEFSFTAPTPWIFGATGGPGVSVADGYFIMVAPLSAGTHTIHYAGSFHFTLAEDGFDLDLPYDITYHVTVK
jgi:hypothetical protein